MSLWKLKCSSNPQITAPTLNKTSESLIVIGNIDIELQPLIMSRYETQREQNNKNILHLGKNNPVRYMLGTLIR